MLISADDYFRIIDEILSENYGSELSDDGKYEFYNMAAEYGVDEVLTSLKMAINQYDDIQSVFTMIPRILANRRKARKMFKRKENNHE